MPKSVKNSPFSKDNTRVELGSAGLPTVEDYNQLGSVNTPNKHVLRVPQARVLAALMPADPTWPESEWPLLTRGNLGVNAGYTAISGTVTRALNGIKEGSSSGDAHRGLLSLKYVEEVLVDVEGVEEVNYRATPTGALAYLEWAILSGGKLPEVKDRVTCINDRYKKETE